MMNKIGILIALLLYLAPLAVFGADKAGDVVFVKGSAQVERDGKRLNVELKLPIMQGDTITTGDKSIVKILCTDDSILTIAEQSRFSVSEYLFNAEQRQSKSVFKLLFGKIRVIVGRALLKVETETAIAGVRGTVFDIWVDSSTHTTYVSVFEGSVELRNINANIKGLQIVTGGNTSSVSSGEPPTPPVTNPLQPGSQDLSSTFGPGDNVPPPPAPPLTAGSQLGGQINTNTPPIHQTPQGFTKVGISVVFP